MQQRTAYCLGSPFLQASLAGGTDSRGRGLQGAALLWFGVTWNILILSSKITVEKLNFPPKATSF